MRGRGVACMVGGGMCGSGGCVWQGGMHGGGCGGGCVADTTVNERAVSILLECILVSVGDSTGVAILLMY